MANAQFKIGYFSYNEALKSMPEYAVAQASIDSLTRQYDVETKRVESEFNSKYEVFLEEQSDLVAVIRQKRQAELQEMMEKNIAFKREAERLLEVAAEEAVAPLRKKLDAALKEFAASNGFIIILNTDANACPYIDEDLGENVSAAVKEALTAE